MSNTVERLKSDHRRMRNVLNALENKANELDADASTELQDELYCMVGYLAEYPDAVHHPLEDRIFTQLRRRLGSSEDERIDDLAHQHKQLLASTQSILRAINELSSEASYIALRQQILDYIARQREHMSLEERGVFVLAERLLNEAAFKDLDSLSGQASDPLFDKVEKKFAALYKYLELDPQDEALVGLGQPLYKFLKAAGVPRN